VSCNAGGAVAGHRRLFGCHGSRWSSTIVKRVGELRIVYLTTAWRILRRAGRYDPSALRSWMRSLSVFVVVMILSGDNSWSVCAKWTCNRATEWVNWVRD
jgi:hypothetical protein